MLTDRSEETVPMRCTPILAALGVVWVFCVSPARSAPPSPAAQAKHAVAPAGELVASPQAKAAPKPGATTKPARPLR